MNFFPLLIHFLCTFPCWKSLAVHLSKLLDRRKKVKNGLEMFWRLWAWPQKDTSGRSANCEIFMAPTCIGSLFMKWVGAFALRCLFFSATYHFCHRLRFGRENTPGLAHREPLTWKPPRWFPLSIPSTSFIAFLFACHAIVRLKLTALLANISYMRFRFVCSPNQRTIFHLRKMRHRGCFPFMLSGNKISKGRISIMTVEAIWYHTLDVTNYKWHLTKISQGASSYWPQQTIYFNLRFVYSAAIMLIRYRFPPTVWTL